MKFLGLFIVFIALVSYYRNKNTAAQNELEDRFWSRENQANHIRRQDISGLPYITIPLENFPMDICDNSELNEYKDTLTQLSGQKILNLSGQTNTDLKLKYGPANLTTLTEYDQNYITLCRTLVSFGECLIKLGYRREAQTVLEFGISCGSDISQNYMLLADLYLADGNTAAVEHLKTQADALDSLMKASILEHLEEASRTA